MEYRRSWWIVISMACVGMACSGEDEGDSGSMAGAQTAMPAAPAASPAGASGAAGATATADPQQQLMDIVDMLLPECDPNVPTTATCGGVQCDAQTQVGAALCLVPCCAQQDGAEVCGTRSADLTMPDSTCMPPLPPADPDPLCPEFDTGMGTILPGCCMDTAVCGVISSLTQQCITESPFITLPATPPPCDGSGLTAGMDAPDAGAMDMMDPMDAADAGSGMP